MCERASERACTRTCNHSLSLFFTHARTRTHSISLSHTCTLTHTHTHAHASNLFLGFLYSHNKHRLTINRLFYAAEKEFVPCEVGIKLLYKFIIQVNL